MKYSKLDKEGLESYSKRFIEVDKVYLVHLSISLMSIRLNYKFICRRVLTICKKSTGS